MIKVWPIFLLPFVLLSCNKDDVITGGGDDEDYDINIVTRPATETSDKWISEIFQYRPAPGQWINEAGYGLESSPQTIVGKKGMVSLGAFGGYIVFGFDHSVLNRDGYDFVIHGNAYDGSSEPGIVRVSVDVNGNGIPDDPWYELRGASHDSNGTISGYSVTYYKPEQLNRAADIEWSDNQGNSGIIESSPVAMAHPHTFYPLFLTGEGESLTYTGTRLGSNVSDTGTPDAPHWYMSSAGAGYADNFSDDYNDVLFGDNDTRRSNKFDISDAVDANGKPISIRAIDFIMVYTGILDQAGTVGEVSTEICGAISLTATN